MKTEKVTRVFYSATGTTNKIISAVEEGLNFEKKREVNLTDHKIRKSFELKLEKDELLIVGVAVYAGKIPDFFVPSLKKLNGDGQLAVIIAVYGNVAAGRPDASDLQKSKEFGAAIGKKLEKLSCSENIESLRINNDGSFMSFALEKLPIPQYGSKKFVKKPDVDLEICTDCKICAQLCPVSAIDIESLKINDSICIR